MSHNYLFDTYQFLQQRLEKARSGLTNPAAEGRTRSYAAGQIEALCELELFLKERYEIKLPRRLRHQHPGLEKFCTKTG